MYSRRKSLFATLLSIVIIASSIVCGDVHAAKKKRSINSVKREQQAAQKNIKETAKKLDANTKRTEQGLMRLNELETELKMKTQQIEGLRSSLDSLDSHIKLAGDSMAVFEKRLAELKDEYARALRKMQGSYRDTDMLSYIFSSKNFSEAAARYRYLREFSNWRKRKTQEIAMASQRVDAQRQQLGSLHGNRSRTLQSLAGAESQLRAQRDETDQMVSQLKKEGSQLQAVIAKNQKRLKSLDNELDRMIVAEQQRIEKQRKAEEQRRAEQERKAKQKNKAKASQGNKNKGRKHQQPTTTPNAKPQQGLAEADRHLSGSFESNKGRLLFPVRGHYTIVRGYGRQQHPELPNVVTDNSGIDIAAAEGTRARSVFEGTVSGVFSHDGYSRVVMIRHGSYISIYANLSNINVKVGDKVKANQDLGTISRDPQYGNRPVLHFELRRERAKLNPLQWVK